MKYEANSSNLYKMLRAEEVEGMTFESHIHLSYEIFCVLEGELLCTVSGKSYTLKSGDTIIILPNQVHSYYTNLFSRAKMMIFSPDYIAEFHSFFKNREFECPIFHFDAKSLTYPPHDNLFAWKGILYSLVGEALNQNETKSTQNKNLSLSQKIIDYVSSHSNEKLTLEELSYSLGYSYHYVSNCIKTNFGVNFTSLVNNYRIDKAATLLRTTELSITQVALQSGFSSIRSFNRSFKKIHGITPSEFVENKRN